MSKEYPKVALGELLMPVSRPVNIDAGQTYRLLGAHWYAEGLYIKDTKSGASIQAEKLYLVEEDDFVYNRLFAWKGSFAIATSNDHGCYVSNEFPTFTINRDKLDGQYLWRYFGRASAWDEALGLSSGGTPTSRNRLKEEKLLAIEIPLPPLEEQRRIVARIEALAAKIEEARGLRQTTIQDVNFITKAAREHVTQNIPLTNWMPLGTYVERIENGWSPACEGYPSLDNEWGVLKLGAISFGTFNENENKALPLTMEPRPEYEVHVGDFLMSRANTTELVGACALVKKTREKIMLSDKIFRFVFRDNSQIDLCYLGHILKSPDLRKQIESKASGTSQSMKNISKGDVLSLDIPYCSISEQKRIAAYLDNLQSRVDVLKRHQAETSAELDALLPSILDKAFKGEL